MTIGKPLRWTLAVASVAVVAAVVSGQPGTIRAQQPKPETNKAEGDAPSGEGLLLSKQVEEYQKAMKQYEESLAKAGFDIKSLEEPGPEYDAEMAKVIAHLDATLPNADSIKPLPEPAIPDDPPPHEGAMIVLPYRIGSPDLVVVEVLEALVGRPIGGERLVRPDGTITLGFYGDLYVRGLTPRQAKTKIILHLRKYLPDDTLGLIGTRFAPAPASFPGGDAPPLPPPPGGEPPLRPKDRQGPVDAPPRAPAEEGKATPKSAGLKSLGGLRSPLVRFAQFPSGNAAKPLREPAFQVREKAAEKPPEGDPLLAERPPVPDGGTSQMFPIAPVDSDRVFVDVASYNSKVYYVLGEVGSPGRLPCTGDDTVLAAIQHTGGLVSTADPKSIKLIRPASGGKPSRIYPIDLAAIQDRGDIKANLQLFPGDRLLVGRKATAEAAVKVSDLLAPSATVLSHLLSYAHTIRSLNNIEEPYNDRSPTVRVKLGGFNLNMNLGPDAPADPEKRKAALKSWSELISKDPAAREEILKFIK